MKIKVGKRRLHLALIVASTIAAWHAFIVPFGSFGISAFVLSPVFGWWYGGWLLVKPTEHFVESSGAAAAIAVANSSWFSDSLFSRGGVHPLLALAAVLLSWLLGLLVAGYMVEPLKKLVELKDY